MTHLKLLLAFCLLAIFTAHAQAPLSTKSIFSSMKKVADWQLAVLDTGKWKYPSTDWTNAAYYTGQMAWAKMANDDKHLLFLKNIGEQNKWQGGPDQRYFADDYAIGQTYAQLYMLYRDTVMIGEMMRIGDELIAQPHTESLLWNFEGGLHNREWAWCDALYMGPPMLAYLTTATGKMKYLDIANKLWWRTADYLYSKEERLMFRDSRFFARKEKNGQKVFWSRGNGWVIAGITRMVNNMPKSYKDRPKYIKLYKKMATRIASLQQPDGTWHASLLDPASYPVKETSGTAFFAYALAWGINNGHLSYKDFFPVVKKAWDALNGCVHPNGKLGFVQVPGAAPEKVTFDDTETYGVGAYLLAGTELFKLMYAKETAALRISVGNKLPADRRTEMVEVPWSRFSTANFSAKKIKVMNAQSGEEVPSQIIYAGNKTPEKVIFQAGVTAGSSNYFYVKNEQPSTYPAQTFGRLVPERKDDFTWENDLVAFRMYGPALQASGEISSGIDVWGKRTNKLVIDNWYKQNDYHKDHGEGMDFYGVGTTLGAGGAAPFINGKLYPSQNFASYKILDNGPLRTTFQLFYKPWLAATTTVSETKTITLDAGSFLNRIEEKYSFEGKRIPVAIGIAKLPGDNKVMHRVDNNESMIAYQQTGNYGALNIGVLLPAVASFKDVQADTKDHYGHTGHVLLTTTYHAGKPFVYYQGAAWNKQGTITTQNEWMEYLETKRTALIQPLVVTIQSAFSK